MSLLLSFFLLFIFGCSLFAVDAFLLQPSKPVSRASHIYSSPVESANSASFKLLVLGGTGFVGREIVKRARQKGFTVVSISRRGKLIGETDESVTWVSGDAAQFKTVQAVIDDFGPFDGCVHAVGLLLDTESGLSALNKFASGSGSSPNSESTYDRVTRMTAFTAIDCLTAKASSSSETPKPFVFISAAEAGWTFKSPVVFLEKYLTAKRAVEDKAMSNDALRTVILRPSLIWTWDKPAALASVIPFYIGNSLGLPFVDKPVLLNTLVDAALASLQDKSVQGILRFSQMEELAAKVTRL